MNTRIPMLMLPIMMTILSCAGSNYDAEKLSVYFKEDNQNYILFSTKDENDANTAYLQAYKSTYSERSTVEAIVIKNSGYENAGFGVIYRYKDNENFDYLIITKNGKYRWSGIRGGHETRASGYTSRPDIGVGDGIMNKISITYDAIGERYNLRFNDQRICASAGCGIEEDKSGQAGFICSVGSETEEDFKLSSVNCQFKMLSPQEIP